MRSVVRVIEFPRAHRWCYNDSIDQVISPSLNILGEAARRRPMITIRTIADVTVDRQVIVCLPPETPLGKAELVVTVAPQEETALPRSVLRNRFGAVHSGDARGADNDRIDDDLAQASLPAED